MDFSSWLDAEPGRAKRVADFFGISTSAVSQWKKNGVPVAHMKVVERLSAGSVTLAEMVPEPADDLVLLLPDGAPPQRPAPERAEPAPVAAGDQRAGERRDGDRRGEFDTSEPCDPLGITGPPRFTEDRRTGADRRAHERREARPGA